MRRPPGRQADMRAVLGVISLLIVLAVAAVLARKQLGMMSAQPVRQQNPALVDPSASLPMTPATATLQVQSQQIQQQIKQSVEEGMQPRAMPDDAK